jgi:hypothetical protein
MPGYNYTAITVEDTPLVIGQFFIQTVPVDERGVVIQKAQPSRPGFGWQALWRRTDGPQPGGWHHVRPPEEQRALPREDDAAHMAARTEIEAVIQQLSSRVPVYLFPAGEHGLTGDR